MKKLVLAVTVVMAVFNAWAYEINNHADMSEEAAKKSLVATTSKQLKLGLRALPLTDSRQRFPLSDGLPAIRYCFGEYLPGGIARAYDANTSGRAQDPSIEQPTWGGPSGGTQLAVGQMFRYGACFEDSESPLNGHVLISITPRIAALA